MLMWMMCSLWSTIAWALYFMLPWFTFYVFHWIVLVDNKWVTVNYLEWFGLSPRLRSRLLSDWKKCSEETQALHAGCSKVEPKILPRRRPRFLGARDGQNLISWRWSLPLPTNPVWWGSMHAISSYRGNRPTQTFTHPQTGPITIHCTAASAQCNYWKNQCVAVALPSVSWKHAV